MDARHSQRLHRSSRSEGHRRLTIGPEWSILIVMEDGPVADEKATPRMTLQHAQMGNQIAG